MNCYKINTTLDFFLPQNQSWYIPSTTTFFHCISTGHYWRNSQITELSLLYEEENGNWTKKNWILEKESDEYDMLKEFSEALSDFKGIVGFNSNSFHIPYLEQKYKAYGLSSPFANKVHTDLLKEIKPIGKHLHISTKLNDLRIFLNLPENMSEIECIAASSALYRYEEILNGAFSVLRSELIQNELLIHCQTEFPFPSDIRIHDTEFYLIGSKNELKIKVGLYQNRLKMYYNNIKDYYYLPEEDMAIHKSLASAIPKGKKIKATADNCYGYIPYSEGLGSNPSALKQYLTALLHHYKTT